jgi:hypothetical protein
MAAVEITDHEAVRSWIEQHGGQPMVVAGTAGDDGADGVGVLKIEFGEAHDESLVPLSWDEFFRRFDEAGLALVHGDDNGRSPPAEVRLVGRHDGPRRSPESQR